jgi:hypothetical protein
LIADAATALQSCASGKQFVLAGSDLPEHQESKLARVKILLVALKKVIGVKDSYGASD